MNTAVSTVWYIDGQLDLLVKHPQAWGGLFAVEMQLLTLLRVRGFLLDIPDEWVVVRETWRKVCAMRNCGNTSLTEGIRRQDDEAVLGRTKGAFRLLVKEVKKKQGDPPPLVVLAQEGLKDGADEGQEKEAAQ